MKRMLVASAISLSDEAIDALKREGIYSLQELIARRDSGLLALEKFDSECFEELQNACRSIDDFNNGLKKNLLIYHKKQQPNDINKKRYIYIQDKYTLIKLKDAVLELFKRVPSRKMNIADVENILRKVFGDDLSEDYLTISETLAELANEGQIEKIDGGDYYRLIRKNPEEEVIYPFDKIAKFKVFLDENIGKEIEFRYKTSRPGSENKWRKIKLYGQGNNSFFATECYPSGRRIQYVKSKVIEYREAKNGRV